MFEYLVPSSTRRKLLAALWKDGARGTASSLARRTGVPVGASYGELRAMSRAGLARESVESGRVVYEAERDSPYATALRQLVAPPPKAAKSKRPLAAHWEAVRTELAARGAPLWRGGSDATASGTPLEELLAQASELARHDPSVAKVLPHVFLQAKSELSFDRLERALTEHKQKHAAGFLLAVAGELSGDATVSAWAERLRDKRRTKRADYFAEASSKRLQALAERNTPALARAWNFRLNMSLDDFRSVMDKFPERVGREPAPALRGSAVSARASVGAPRPDRAERYHLVLSKLVRASQADLAVCREMHERKALELDVLVQRYLAEMNHAIGRQADRDQSLIAAIEFMWDSGSADGAQQLIERSRAGTKRKGGARRRTIG